jgi:hypothetical protein
MAYRNLTAADGTQVIINDSQIVSVVPSGSGSKITFALQSEGHPVSIVVSQTPTQVLSAETVS